MTGHPVPKQCYCMTQRSPRASSLHDGTHTPTADMAFAVGRSCDPKPERRVIDRFPRSHYRPSIINVPSLVQPVAGKPVKRWNFRKANWELFTAETERRTPGLPNQQAGDADATYSAYCNMHYAQRRRTSHAASTNTTSPDGTTAATTSFANTSRPPPRKTSTQWRHHYSRSWMKYAGPGGLR